MAEKSWETLDPAEADRRRDRLLEAQVRHQVYPFSPHYRRLFDGLGVEPAEVSGTAGLASLPATDRAGLASAPDDFVLQPSPALIQRWGSGSQVAAVAVGKLLRGAEFAAQELRHEYEPVQVLVTSGTTGDPVAVRLSRRDVGLLASQGRRAWEAAGVRAGDAVLNLLPPEGFAFWPLWVGAIALGARHAAGSRDPERAAELARRVRAAAVAGWAGELVALLEAGAPPELRTLVLGPEEVPPGTRSRLAAMTGARIVGTYGFAEGRTVWPECSEGSRYPDAGYHTSPETDLVEVTGAAALEGGEVLYTGLDHRGTALLRYRPGDLAGGLRRGKCPYCGRWGDRILGPVRRAGAAFTVRLGGGASLSVDPGALAAVFAHPGLAAWQVEVAKTSGDPRGDDDVVVLYRPRPGVDAGSLAVELDRELQARTGLSPTQFVVSDRTVGGVVDLRAPTRPRPA